MAYLEKHSDNERESWLRWGIEFMRRGLWLDVAITVHGPHDSTQTMWGQADASIDGEPRACECTFLAKAGRSKYDPIRIRIQTNDERFPILRVSQLTPKARRWLKAARIQLKKCAHERIANSPRSRWSHDRK